MSDLSASSSDRKTAVLTPADRLGRPVSRVLALDLSVTVQDVVVDAAVPNLLLVAVRSHHSEGDEAVGDPSRDGAAHIWLSESRGGGSEPEGGQNLGPERGWPTPAHGRLCSCPVGPAGAPLVTRSLGRVALIRPALPVLDGVSRNGFIVDYFSTRGRLRQGTVHSCGGRKKAERLGKFPFPSSQTFKDTGGAAARPLERPQRSINSKICRHVAAGGRKRAFFPPPPFLPGPATRRPADIFLESGVLVN